MIAFRMQVLSFFSVDRPKKSGSCLRDMTEKKGSSLYNKCKCTSECSNYCRKHEIITILNSLFNLPQPERFDHFLCQRRPNRIHFQLLPRNEEGGFQLFSVQDDVVVPVHLGGVADL